MFGIDSEIFYFIGVAAVFLQALSLCSGVIGSVYRYFLRPSKSLKKYGEWAVVTGGTDGIGLAYAKELARKGLNIVLLSRSQEKLDACAAEIADKYKVQTKVICADFNDTSIYPRIQSQLKDVNVGILVNNVGISYDHPDFFLEISDALREKLINLNIVSVNEMTKIVLPGMVSRKKGAIVNISSISGEFPVSLLTVYSATKSYVNFFSQGLAEEYGRSGIFVQSLMPSFVATAMSKMKPSLMTPSASAYARSAVATIGHDNVTHGYIIHDLMAFVMGILPKFLVSNRLWALHMSFRTRALKRKARLAAEKKSE